MIIAGTGHRPNKLGGYGDEVFNRLVKLAMDELHVRMLNEAEKEFGDISVISGMALGWDQALAVAANSLGISFTAAVPFEGQEKVWPDSSQRRYREILDLAKRVEILFPQPANVAFQMQRRNEWMVDNCDLVLALWNGSAGGTNNCIMYAHKEGRPVVNLWSKWVGAEN